METSTTNGPDTEDIDALREKVSRLEALIDLPPEIPLEKAPSYRTLWEAFTDAVALNKRLQMKIEAYTYRSNGMKKSRKQLTGRIVQLEAEVFDLQRELDERDKRIRELEDMKA